MGRSSLTTHGLKVCADSCRVFAGLMVGALEGKERTELLSLEYAKHLLSLCEEDISYEVTAVLLGSYRDKHRDEIISSGYVVTTLEAALWAFCHTESFEGDLISAVNLRYDADTIGAVYGQLGGVYYGLDAIPGHLRSSLMRNFDIVELVLLLMHLK